MGSHSEEVVHRTRLPVLVLRREAVWPPVRLVFGYNHSEDAKKAAEMAATLGGLFGIHEAVLVHAYPRLLDEVSDTRAADYAMRRAEKELEARAAELEGVWATGRGRSWPRATPRLPSWRRRGMETVRRPSWPSAAVGWV